MTLLQQIGSGSWHNSHSVTGISARKYTKHFISYSMWYLLSKIILKTCINNKISFCFNMQELIYENYIKWTCTLVENSIHCAWIFLKRVTWIQEDYLIPWEFLINVWDCENQYSVAIERYERNNPALFAGILRLQHTCMFLLNYQSFKQFDNE